MSFDTEFNYTTGKTAITAKIASINSQIAMVDAQIAALTEANAPANLINDKQMEKVCKQAEIYGLQSLKTEISVVEALSAGNKEILYKFWLALANDKLRYMSEICYNHTAMLADTDFVNLANNTVLTPAEKKTQGEAIMVNYPICFYNYAMVF